MEIVSRAGLLLSPTVLTDVTPGSPVHEQEMFGPVMPIVPFSDVDEVIAIANATEYGLASYLYTRDLATAFKVSEELQFGMVGINDWYPATPEAPFGGHETVRNGARVRPGRRPRVFGAEDEVLRGDRVDTRGPPSRGVAGGPEGDAAREAIRDARWGLHIAAPFGRPAKHAPR